MYMFSFANLNIFNNHNLGGTMTVFEDISFVVFLIFFFYGKGKVSCAVIGGAC